VVHPCKPIGKVCKKHGIKLPCSLCNLEFTERTHKEAIEKTTKTKKRVRKQFMPSRIKKGEK